MAEKQGYIKLYRGILDHPLYMAEPFTRLAAWIDLLLIANHKKGYIYVRGNRVTVERGQVGMSERNLAERWKWSRGKVRRFIAELESDHQIKHQKNPVKPLISIINYNKYQDNGTTERTPDSTPDEPQTVPQTNPRRYQNNNDKNGKNDKNVKKREGKFSPPTIDEIKKYCHERKNKVDPEKWFDHYTANGWLVGKNKMRDWKASVRTWERNSYGTTTDTKKTMNIDELMENM